MSGFEGFISIFEDDNYTGTSPAAPQALHVDKESLSLGKYIEYNQNAIGSSRVGLSSHLIFKEKKPQGGLTFQFRSSDILKPLLAHFQNGSQAGTRFYFYPRANPLDYNYQGTLPNQGYGRAVAKPYTISLLKRMYNTYSTGDGDAPTSFFFKNGLCDKLSFSVTANEDAKAEVNFLFRDVDYATAVVAKPGSEEVGSYSPESPFCYWAATVTIGGEAFELSSFSVTSDQGAQEYTKVGRQDPQSYQFANYSCKGNFSFDLPRDAWEQVGSMFDGESFAFVATFYNGIGDQVVIDMPHCKRLPFDYNFTSGDKPIVGKIPFQAFENAGTYPIRITVDTQGDFPNFLVLDALLGPRGVLGNYDAVLGPRILANFIILNRV